MLANIRVGNELGVYWALALAAFTVASMAVFMFPVPASLGVVAAGALLLGVRSPGWTLLLYAASLFLFQVPLFTDILVAVPTAAGFFFLTATFLNVMVMRRAAHLHSRVPGFLALFALVVLLSALNQFEWFDAHSRPLVTYWALCATAFAGAIVLRDGNWIWRLVHVFAVGTLVISLMAIYESWTGHYNPFGLFAGTEQGRAYGLADPNYTAALLVTLLPFLLALFQCRRSLVSGVLTIALIVLSCAAIAMTGSRGGILGTIVTALAILILVTFKGGNQVSREEIPAAGRNARGGRLGLGGMLLLSLFLAAALAPSLMWERMATFENWSDPNKNSRLQIWADYLKGWQTSPWWGLGPGFADQKGFVQHNTLLQILVETGVVGLAAFVLVNGAVVWEIVRARRRFAMRGQQDLAILSGATAASLVGFHSTAFFLTSATHKELWLLLGLAVALCHLSRPSESPAS